ncbi:Methyltransferase domain-containing protein [Asanoa hainanensis]|uniref:Methyltransferase domain-containing protein n=1 Tax=Asanoa hainanensis TaxID=560556 RepID=A0A239LNP7_9ACTN|nr:class I SAM-dependent methyltransferase [Asanoa hainanensis]SNT31995.1 Methyltransferase domain-containing protein [Asanoa hainanensis]
MTLDAHRLSFGAAADYDQARPTYPMAAVHWTLGADRLRVVDLGAGTGSLSRVIAAAGHEVIPIEPDQDMRTRFDAAGVRALAGSAEAIPLPDASVDAVLAGTAYHWFDPEPAHQEMARVLRRGGVLAAIWNDRDKTTPWVAELSRLIRTHRQVSGRRAALEESRSFGPLFGEVTRQQFPHVVAQSPQGLAALVASRSTYLTATPAEQRLTLDRIAELCATHPDLTGRDTFDLPYVTTVYRALRV